MRKASLIIGILVLIVNFSFSETLSLVTIGNFAGKIQYKPMDSSVWENAVFGDKLSGMTEVRLNGKVDFVTLIFPDGSEAVIEGLAMIRIDDLDAKDKNGISFSKIEIYFGKVKFYPKDYLAHYFKVKTQATTLEVKGKSVVGADGKIEALETEAGVKPPIITIAGEINVGVDKVLKAGEEGEIVIQIENRGKGDAKGLWVELKPLAGTNGISVTLPGTIDVPASGSKIVTIKVAASKSIQSGFAEYKITIKEPFFQKDSDPLTVKFETQEFLYPQFNLIDWGIDDDKDDESYGNNNHSAEEGENIELEVIIGNTGEGRAMGVFLNATVTGNGGVVLISDLPYFNLGDIAPGDYRKVKIPLSIGKNLSVKDVKIQLDIKETKGSLSLTEFIEFGIGKQKIAPKEVVVGKPGSWDVKSAKVDIDEHIPKGKSPYSNPIAVIIGNKDYANDIKQVEFAVHDAEIVKKYFITTFGIPEKNILYKENADGAVFNDIFGPKDNASKSRLYQTALKQKPDAVYIYYSGHGIPGLSDKKGYFAPVNVIKDNAESTGYSLDVFYQNLAILKKSGVKKIIVIIDACFSGDSDVGMIIEDVSPIYAKVDNELVADDIGTVFTATSGNDYATWFREKYHGLFTYYFLKGVGGDADKNADKKITILEMREYLLATVPDEAMFLKGIAQTPQIRGLDDEIIVILK
ncbi:MAG: hypothetical protein A2Y33_09050 [Spirochaetes bacterium GWF1_51_8]|nr:MAG: hypothetical protein A2Y33_09050 [Spirochaetes bacterium GWF1_51_8]